MTSHFPWASRTTPLQNRGRNFVRGKRRPPYMSSTTFTCFCALTIRKQLPRNDFERSGRGQEPSRGHKFSILENVVLRWDFTSAMRLHFRSDLVGACLPQPLLRTDEEELCQFMQLISICCSWYSWFLSSSGASPVNTFAASVSPFKYHINHAVT